VRLPNGCAEENQLSINNPTLPPRSEFRRYADAAIATVNATIRCGLKMTTGFYAKTGDAVFEASYRTLEDRCEGRDNAPLHVINAPAGAGKTSFAYAVMLAVTNYAEDHKDAPYGCAIVVNEIVKADEVYKELDQIAPGTVAVWTTDHDKRPKADHSSKPEEERSGFEPAAKFTQDELRHYPIVVVTQQFFQGKNGHKALNVRRGEDFGRRAFIIIDEQPNETDPFELVLSDAERVREALQKPYPELKEHFDPLFQLMEAYSYRTHNTLYRPRTDGEPWDFEALNWFASPAAEDVAQRYSKDVPGTRELLGYAAALTRGDAYVWPTATQVSFFGYRSKAIRGPGILLDATADIDGVAQVAPDRRSSVEVPQARYDNLTVIHVPQHTKKRLKEYFGTAAHRRAYVKHVVDKMIKPHMTKDENGLVVCKLDLLKNENVPQWPEGDPKFKEADITGGRAWDVEGRKLCATHWGSGVGSNAWKDDHAILLCDEFYTPRRSALMTAQSIRELHAHEGELGAIATVNSKAEALVLIEEGRRLRHIKQLAMRGNARNFDEHGICGKQKVVIMCDLKHFRAFAPRLFPGATIVVSEPDTAVRWHDKVIEAVIGYDDAVLTTGKLGELIKRPWREVLRNVVTPDFLKTLADHGWHYEKRKGRGGARFVRLTAEPAQAA
jgi:hypothetical protein